jgi:hypothetical protein
MVVSLVTIQDSQLLLQEYRLYWRTLVVPDILCLEFDLVSFCLHFLCSSSLIAIKRIGIYIPLILELFLDDCACYWHWLV